MPPARDGDRRPPPDRGGLEDRLAKAPQAVDAGDAEVGRHDPLTDQPVRQVAGDVGLGLAPVEVAAGRLDGLGQGPAQLSEPLSLERREREPQGPERDAGAGPGARQLVQDAGDPLAVAQLDDDPARVLVPGAFLEPEAEPGQLHLEGAGALDVVGDDGPARPVDVEQDRAELRAVALAQVAPRGGPGDRVGPAEHQDVVPGRVEEGGDPALLLLDVAAACGARGFLVINRRIDEDQLAYPSTFVALFVPWWWIRSLISEARPRDVVLFILEKIVSRKLGNCLNSRAWAAPGSPSTPSRGRRGSRGANRGLGLRGRSRAGRFR